MKVRDPESVASHMFRMGMMALVLEDSERSDDLVLGGSAVVLTVLHDLAECIVGDIVPEDKVSLEEKHRMETEAMKKLVLKLPGSLAKELYTAFDR